MVFFLLVALVGREARFAEVFFFELRARDAVFFLLLFFFAALEAVDFFLVPFLRDPFFFDVDLPALAVFLPLVFFLLFVFFLLEVFFFLLEDFFLLAAFFLDFFPLAFFLVDARLVVFLRETAFFFDFFREEADAERPRALLDAAFFVAFFFVAAFFFGMRKSLSWLQNQAGDYT